MYKRFFEQRITCYDEQWYCYSCKTTLQNLTKAQHHSENAHSTTSTQTFNFPDKSVTLKKNRYKTFVKHSIVIRDVEQDYFCMNCQCSISFHNVHCHLNAKDHQKRMNTKSKCSINKEQNSNNVNNKQSTTVNVKNSTKRINESNFSSEIKPIYKLKSASNSSTQTVNGTIAGVPYALLQEAKTYKHFSMQYSTYNGQWYCRLCRSMFHSLTNVKCHSQEVHSAVDTQISDFWKKSIRSSGKIWQELLNHDKKDMTEDYFCLSCQCSKPSLDHFYEHLVGNEHKCIIKSNEKYVDTSVVPETPANEQQNVNNDTADEQNVSISASDKIYSINDLRNFKTEDKSIGLFKYSCDQCNKIIEADVINHEITVHKSDMMSSIRYINDCLPAIKDFNIAIHYPLFRCLFCNEIIHGVLSLANHLSKREHEENVKFLIDTKERECDNRVQIYFEPRKLLSVISFKNNNGTVQIKEQPVMYIRNSSEKRFIYVCFVCPYVDHVIEHLCKMEHLKHLKNILLTYNYMHDTLESKERSVNGIREMTLAFKDVSLKKREINETRVNTEPHDHNLIAVANVSNKNDDRNEENNSGLFISLDIFADIDRSMYQRVGSVSAQSRVKSNKKSALDCYNNMYSGEFLDFEKIMFTCSERKLDEMKLNLQFFLSHYDNIVCLVCNDSQLSNAQTVYEHINCKEHITRFKKLHENEEHVELLKELIQPTRFQQAKCYACDEIFNGRQKNASNRIDFKYHARFSRHKYYRKLHSLTESILEEFQNLCYNIQYFACVRCNERFKQKIKFLKHLNANHRAILIKKDNSMFDFCLTCATLWYDDENYIGKSCTNYQKHCRLLTHQYLQKSNDFAVTSLPQSLQELLKNVNGTAGNLFNLSNDVLDDQKMIQVTDALKHIFETHRLPVEVYTFGSRVTGLALPNSDVDIYLNFGNEYTEPELIESRSKQIQNCLRVDQENWNVELILNRSRTPIIKVKHRLTGLQCDISFMNGLAVENSKLIRSFNKAYPPCKKLTLFLKKWLSLGDLTGSDGITNYTLVWLVIFYLQVKFEAAIPSIAALIKSHNQSKIVSGWETGVGDIIFINIPKLPINELLLGFFEYYRSFDYMQFVICPLLGETCQKRAFAEISTLPNSMTLYIAQLRNKNPEYFRTDSPMCVQDPFDLSHNLTKAVSILMLKRFKNYCNESSKVLQHIATSSKKRHKIILR